VTGDEKGFIIDITPCVFDTPLRISGGETYKLRAEAGTCIIPTCFAPDSGRSEILVPPYTRRSSFCRLLYFTLWYVHQFRQKTHAFAEWQVNFTHWG
jgi:hypothetical protein